MKVEWRDEVMPIHITTNNGQELFSKAVETLYIDGISYGRVQSDRSIYSFRLYLHTAYRTPKSMEPGSKDRTAESQAPEYYGSLEAMNARVLYGRSVSIVFAFKDDEVIGYIQNFSECWVFSESNRFARSAFFIDPRDRAMLIEYGLQETARKNLVERLT